MKPFHYHVTAYRKQRKGKMQRYQRYDSAHHVRLYYKILLVTLNSIKRQLSTIKQWTAKPSGTWAYKLIPKKGVYYFQKRTPISDRKGIYHTEEERKKGREKSRLKQLARKRLTSKEDYQKNKAKYKQYKDAHREYYRAYGREYSKRPRRRLMINMRVKLGKFIKQKGSTIKCFGCSPDELRQHIQNQFKPGMNWNNYGKGHVDHIRPLASFDLTNRDEVLRASHWTNLQPLWAEDNLKKADAWDGQQSLVLSGIGPHPGKESF